jgi:hypothetical protein
MQTSKPKKHYTAMNESDLMIRELKQELNIMHKNYLSQEIEQKGWYSMPKKKDND